MESMWTSLVPFEQAAHVDAGVKEVLSCVVWARTQIVTLVLRRFVHHGFVLVDALVQLVFRMLVILGDTRFIELAHQRLRRCMTDLHTGNVGTVAIDRRMSLSDVLKSRKANVVDVEGAIMRLDMELFR